jgi:hypothetical protein
MSLEFTNIIKGAVTQTLLSVLFERGGYRVTRLGIEELFSEIKHIELSNYVNLNLPMQLRSLPDLLIAETDMSHVFLVEVKIRKKFNEDSAESIFESPKEQRKYWPQAYVVIMVAEALNPTDRFHQDYVRVLRPSGHEALIDKRVPIVQRWEKLEQLQRVFTKFNNDKLVLDVQKAADTLTQTLRDLAKL